jgi:hypothetical protein
MNFACEGNTTQPSLNASTKTSSATFRGARSHFANENDKQRSAEETLHKLPQSMPKNADSSPAVLPAVGPATATVLARIDLNGALE